MSVGENRFIEGTGLYVKTHVLPDLIKEDNITISKDTLYKSQMGTGGLYPFYYINPDDQSEKKINVFIENSSCWFSKNFNKASITLNEDDTNYLTKFNKHLKDKGKQFKYNCKNDLVKTREDGTNSINVKFYVKDNKITANILDLSKGGRRIEKLDKNIKCEGNFVIKISGIFKGNVGTFLVVYLVEAWVTPTNTNNSNIISRFLGQSLKDLSVNNNDDNTDDNNENLDNEDLDNEEENLPF